MEYRYTKEADLQLENKLSKNYESPDHEVVQLTAIWSSWLSQDLNDWASGGYEEAILKSESMLESSLWRTKEKILFTIVEDLKGEIYLTILQFIFHKFTINNIIFLEKKQYNLPELLAFHSWMHRLDEVKGARPTFWCD